jgi:hypothetical protein
VKILILVAAIVTVAFLILTLFAVRPRKGQQHIVYKLEGPVGRGVVYTIDGKDQRPVLLPLNFSFWKPRGTSVELTARFQDNFDKGSFEARVYLDGQFVESARGSESEPATVRVTIP